MNIGTKIPSKKRIRKILMKKIIVMVTRQCIFQSNSIVLHCNLFLQCKQCSYSYNDFICNPYSALIILPITKYKFEHTKGIIRSCKSQDRSYNDQKNKEKRIRKQTII